MPNKWAEFLLNGENKNDLISLYLIFIKSPEGIKLADGIPIVFYEKQIVLNIQPYSTELLFRCNHEEADPKIPLHASISESNVVVVAEDTDVFLLLIKVFAQIKPNFQWQMRYGYNQYANINEICYRLGTETSLLLPQFHASTGCDTTSYFFVLERKLLFKKAVGSEMLYLICELGYSEQLTEEGLKNCKEFVRTVLYSGNLNETYLEIRIRLHHNQPIASRSTMTIPPHEDSLTQAIYRAHYHEFIWNHCFSKVIPEISPLCYGWKLNDNVLAPLWFTGSQFPISVTKRKHDGYEADNEEGGESMKMPPELGPTRKLRKRQDVIKIPTCEGEPNGDTVDDFIREWEHLSEFFDSSDSLDSDWMKDDKFISKQIYVFLLNFQTILLICLFFVRHMCQIFPTLHASMLRSGNKISI